MRERTTLQIEIAVTDADPDITDKELRLAIAARSSIDHFMRTALEELVEMVLEEKPACLLQMKAKFHQGTLERMFEAQKKPPAEWLGPGNIPGSPEQQRRLQAGKRIFKKATGLDLDS